MEVEDLKVAGAKAASEARGPTTWRPFRPKLDAASTTSASRRVGALDNSFAKRENLRLDEELCRSTTREESMEDSHGGQGAGLTLDGADEKLHAFVPGEPGIVNTSIEQQHADEQSQLNDLPDSLQLITDGQQAHISGDSDTQTHSGVANNDAAHLIQTSRQQNDSHAVAQQTVGNGTVQHHTVGNAHGQANQLHSHQLPPHAQSYAQLQSQHLLQPFLTHSPIPQLQQHTQFQLQQHNANNSHMLEARNGHMHTMLPSAPPHEQPLSQNLIPNFPNPPSIEASQPPSTRRESYFSNMKMIPDPPDLQKWREKLFHVEDTIVLSEEQ